MAEKKQKTKIEKQEKKIAEEKVVEAPTQEIKKEETKQEKTEKIETKTSENKSEDKKSEKKEDKKKIHKIKKTEVFVFSTIPCSMKESRDICKFIKYKSIDDAISLLEQVTKLKKAVPMKGEMPHRKGKGIMAGRYPQKTAQYFIMCLKTLKGNANNHDVENPIIVEAFSNKAYQPSGKFGSVKRKRTHIKITARELKENKKEKKK